MLQTLLSRLARPSRAHDHLFTPFAPEGAGTELLETLYHQYGGALADEFVPPQHIQYRALAAEILGGPPARFEAMEIEALRRVRAAYVACFERAGPLTEELQRWGADRQFRAALLGARKRVVAALHDHAGAERARRAHFARWNECRAAPIDLQGECLFDVITQMNPDDWHEIALRWNWDDGLAELRWITSRRECERATAVYVLCAGRPGDVAAAHKQDERDAFVRALAARLENGFYPNVEIGLALSMRARLAFQQQLDAARAIGQSPWRLPEGLLDHAGRPHRPRYTLIDGAAHWHYEHWLEAHAGG